MNTKHSMLVIPVPSTPVDGALEAFTVVNIFDFIKAVDAQAPIFACDNYRLLEMVVKYADLFDVEFGYLQGYPTCIYRPEFDQVTWSLDRVSYDTLAADLAATKRIEGLKAAEMPVTSRSRVARADGGVKIPAVTGHDADDDGPV